MINILAADKLINAPQLYATFLLWLLSELFETSGSRRSRRSPSDFFSTGEAHFGSNDAPKTLLETIEQVIRLIQSRRRGRLFRHQNPWTFPTSCLASWGTACSMRCARLAPRDQKAVKAAAQTFRQNKDIDVESVITELGVGEALVSFSTIKASRRWSSAH